MNVLSLFDGMSCGRLALDRLGVTVDKYYASEIDKYAITVAKYNFPDIIHIGDVKNIDIEQLPKIDLLIGGSPCQGFSFAGKRKGSSTKEGIEVTSLEQYLKLKDEGFEFDGQSYLFWEYIRILRELQKINPDLKFLLENVMMTKKWKDMFNTAVGCEPIMINSNLVSAQNRKRLYWTNIEVDGQPEDKGILLKDILETPQNNNIEYFGKDEINFEKVKPSIQKNILKHHDIIISTPKTTYIMPVKSSFSDNKVSIKKSITLRANNSCAYVLDRQNKTYRKLTPLECERLQTLPDNYTKAPYKNKTMSDTQRYKMIGNGWTVDVIAHILNGLHSDPTIDS